MVSIVKNDYFIKTKLVRVSPEQMSFISKLKTLLFGAKISRPQNTKSPQDFNLQYGVHTIEGYDNNQLEVWDIHKKDSKTIVLMFHGYSGSKDSLLDNASSYYRQGYSTVLVDFYGSGGSSGFSTSVGIHEAKDVLLSYLYVKKLYPKCKIILHGVSMGGAAILRSISKYSIHPDGVIIESVFDTFLNTVSNRFHAMGLPAFPGAYSLVFWGGLVNGLDGFSHNPSIYVKAVKCPILLMSGSKDKRDLTDQSMAIFNNIQSKKQLSMFTNAGHESLILSNKDQWSYEVNQLIKSISYPDS